MRRAKDLAPFAKHLTASRAVLIFAGVSRKIPTVVVMMIGVVMGQHDSERAVASFRVQRLAGSLIEGAATLVIAIAFAGCAASPQPGASIAQSQGSGDAPRPIFDASGVWEGYLAANCTQFNPLAFNDRCNAMNKIAITMVQNQVEITGFYKCRIGNMDCLNQNDSGTISHGSIENGLVALRIGMPDGSSCIFNGRPTGANLVRGNYTCYQGGGFVEHGRFEITRRY